MSVTETPPVLNSIVRLPEILDLKAAAPLVASLLAMRGSDVLIDAGDVRRVGGQCLQIMLSAQLTWASDSASLEFINPSSDFTESLALLGVDADQFGKSTLQETIS